MRKLNVSMDMFGNTKGKEKKNVTMKYLSLSWQASICLAYLPTSPLFFLSFFCFLCFLYSLFLFLFLFLFSLFWGKYLFDTMA